MTISSGSTRASELVAFREVVIEAIQRPWLHRGPEAPGQDASNHGCRRNRRRDPRHAGTRRSGRGCIAVCFQSLWIAQDLFDIDTHIGDRVVAVARFLPEATLEHEPEPWMEILR